MIPDSPMLYGMKKIFVQVMNNHTYQTKNMSLMATQ